MRFARGFALGLGLIAVAALAHLEMPEVRADEPKPTVSIAKCVKFSQKVGERAIDLTLANGCKTEVACTLSWALVCHGEDGPAPKRKFAESVTLAIGSAHGTEASAAPCAADDGWAISEVKWACEPAE